MVASPERDPAFVGRSDGRGLPGRTRRALLITWGGRVAAQAMQVLTFIVAARVLGPHVYGQYALILTVSGLAMLFNDIGLQASLVFTDRLSDETLASAWWMNLGLGVLVSGALWLISPALTRALHQPETALPLSVAGLSFVTSMSMVPTALLERAVRFRPLALCETSAQGAASAFTITAAYHGFGIYSLAVAPIVYTTSVSLLLTLVTGYRPRGAPSATALRGLWRFSSGMLGFSLANYLNRNMDNLALSRLASARALGLYSRAYSLTMAPVLQVGLVVGRVLFPVLTRARVDGDDLEQAWVEACKPALMLFIPVSLLTAAVAPDFVSALFTSDWASLATLIPVLALAAVPQTLAACFGCVYLALGRTRLLFGLTLVQTLTLAIGIGLGLHAGALGVATGVTVATYVYASVVIVPAMRLLAMSLSTFVRAVTPGVTAGLGIAAAVTAVREAMLAFAIGPMARLVMECLVALALFGVIVASYRTGTSRAVIRPARADVALRD